MLGSASLLHMLGGSGAVGQSTIARRRSVPPWHMSYPVSFPATRTATGSTHAKRRVSSATDERHATDVSPREAARAALKAGREPSVFMRYGQQVACSRKFGLGSPEMKRLLLRRTGHAVPHRDWFALVARHRVQSNAEPHRAAQWHVHTWGMPRGQWRAVGCAAFRHRLRRGPR